MENKILTHNDILIIKDRYRCKENHTVEEVTVEIPYVNADGEVRKNRKTVGYCKECNCYFLNKTKASWVLFECALLCQMVDENDYENGILDKTDASAMLKRHGYTVKKDRKLNDVQRQVVLQSIIDNGVLSKEDVLTVIDKSINQKKDSEYFKEAVEKWIKDREYLLNL